MARITAAKDPRVGERASKFFQTRPRIPHNRQLHYVPFYGDVLLYDSALCYEFVFKKMTPLMDVFMFRFVLSNPVYFKGDLKAFVESKASKLTKSSHLVSLNFLPVSCRLPWPIAASEGDSGRGLGFI
jgi:hypothetical protein